MIRNRVRRNVRADTSFYTGTVKPVVLGERINPSRCFHLSLRKRTEAVWLGAQFERSPDRLRGILLIPRLGLVWHGADFKHERRQDDVARDYGEPGPNEDWHILTAQWQDRLLLYGNYILLERGNYVAVFRILCANWLKPGPLLKLDVWSQEGQVQEYTLHTSDINATDACQDYSVAFHLDHLTDRVELRLRTLAPADISIAHVRLVTGAEAIEERYYEIGGASSKLGVPLRGVSAAVPSRHKELLTTGLYKRFDAGTIYWSGKYGAFEVHGQIGSRYEALGSTDSLLGFPIHAIQDGDLGLWNSRPHAGV